MKYKKNYSDKNKEIAKIAKALSHPARVAILEYLSTLDSCFFGDILEVLPISKATASQHLKELKSSGLIQGEIKPPKVRYCINRENWNKANKLFNNFLKIVEGKNCC